MRRMRRLTNSQITLLAQYFSDLSKILFGASVVGYLFPTSTFPVTLTALIVGSLTAAACLLYAIRLSAELTTTS
jgi:hypothetical protein